jgi:ABC-type sugar transport system ATPase subunit
MHLELSTVTKSYGPTPALREISLSLPPSSVVAVIGQNGEGKSTLLRVLSGLASNYWPWKALSRCAGERSSGEVAPHWRVA